MTKQQIIGIPQNWQDFEDVLNTAAKSHQAEIIEISFMTGAISADQASSRLQDLGFNLEMADYTVARWEESRQ